MNDADGLPAAALQMQSPRRLTVLIVAIAALSTAWILLRTWYGARLTSDAAAYLSGAENLASGNGLVDFEGDELTWFPPGYPIVLAGFEIAGIGAAEASRWLNAVLFGLTVGIAGLWLKTVCRSSAVVLAGVAAIACSPTLHVNAVSPHSEPLYLLLTTGSLIAVSEFLNRQPAGTGRRALRLLATAGLLAGLSFAVRYVGLVAIASSSLLILSWRPARTFLRIRLQAAALFGVAAALPVVAVLARNLVATGRLLGDRLDIHAGHSMLDAVGIITELHRTTRPTFAIGWIMLFGAALICWAAGGRPRPRSFPRRLGRARSAPFAAFVALYAGVSVVTQPLNADPINARLWLPAAIALVFVGCEALDAALQRSSPQDASGQGRRLALAAGTGAVIVVGLAAAVYYSAQNTRDALSLGHADGVIIRELVGSPVIAHLQDEATDGHLTTNRMHGVYLLTGIQPVHLLPWRPAGQTLTDSECLERLGRISTHDIPTGNTGFSIAWFEVKPARPRWYCDIPALAAESPELELVEDFPDGAIYRFDPSG